MRGRVQSGPLLSILGTCKFGRLLRCDFSSSEHDLLVTVTCTLQAAERNCGKRQLRAQTRETVAKNLQETSVFAYRNQEAARIIDQHKYIERLQPRGVLRQAKYEYVNAQYVNADPIKALGILKRKSTLGGNVIQKIGIDPFFVHFWSNHQIEVYNAKAAENGSYLAIDATGKVASEITHVDGSKSKHLYLYTGVLHCKAGPLPVLRRVS